MKKHRIIIGILLLPWVSYGQQAPTGIPHPSPAYGDWYKGGNNGGITSPNIFGTKWNSPIYTQTFGITRTKLNGNVSYNVNTYSGLRDGYMLLGINNNSMLDASNIYANKGAFSLLHLNGEGSVFQEYGYRPWMKTGITFTGNKDLSYFGLRKLSTNLTEEDKTETVFLWSDNTSPVDGPDKLVFRFSGFGGSDGASVSNNRLSTTDLDALHVAQFTGTGLMGLGNTFGTNATGMTAANYIDPKSLLHLSYDWRSGNLFERYGFSQITYRRPNTSATDIIGQGEAETDGLRLGIDNDVFSTGIKQHMNSYLRWQEASSFIIQTEDDLIPSIQANERIRVTSVGALVANYTPAQYIGLTSPLNTTRVAISHNGATPITKPLSLLHLGYNTSTIPILGIPLDDGWRDWMDVGTFTNNGTDNMYVGLKFEGNDRHDAIVNWGDNQVAGNTPNGPDNLRFIFTSTTTALPPGQGDSISQSYNGLETGRFYPGYDTTFTYQLADSTDFYGRFGVGDFTASGVNEDPTHKLDVIGNGRFRYLPDSLYIADSTVNRYVMVDSLGVLRWTSGAPGGFGAACGDTVNGFLGFNTKQDLNNFNFYFEKNDSLGANHVGVGYACGDSLPAKLSVIQAHPNSTFVDQNTIAISGINTDTSDVIGRTFTGVHGEASGLQNPVNRINNIGGSFVGAGATNNYGITAKVEFPSSVPTPLFGNNFGGLFDVVGQGFNNRGIQIRTGNATSSNAGIIATAQTFAPNTSNLNIAGDFNAQGATNENTGLRAIGIGGTQTFGVFAGASAAVPGGISYGIYATSGPSSGANPPTGPNYAGYFNGDVVRTGTDNFTSDVNLKTNINEIDSALSIINQLNPVSFEFNQGVNPQMNLASGLNYGFIAQEVEPILPELIKDNVHPAEYDSLGNIVTPSVSYKSLNYQAFISILAKGMQEQQVELDEKDSLINALNDRLTLLENCLSNILPALCEMNAMTIESTPDAVQEELNTILEVELSDRNNIVLNQNVPNPFAERTVITYSIPETVMQAQIHFYDGQGKLISSVDVNERGNGQLNVYASDLSSGMYTYSLVADGKIVSTKRMVKY